MRTPPDVPPRAARTRTGRARWWIAGAVVVFIVVLASLRSLATLYTDSLWFSSAGYHRVWSTLLAVKVGLFASFGAAFFVLLWANLVVGDRLAVHGENPGLDDDLVRRYQRTVRPYAGRLYAGVSLVVALIAAAAAIGQWNNWLLFTHSTSFNVSDPQFHLDVGFFVFRLPFLQFLVNWTLASLVVVLVVTAAFHYLNGGIHAQRSAPRVQPLVKGHLSVLLALIAVVKACGYLLARYQLDMSSNGYVEGAGYTDVHARLPALEVLLAISLFAAAILLYNIRRQGWALPVIAVGLWAFVALVIGVVYPAVLQALKVNPAQSTLESKYIARNIQATRAAYGIDDVTVSKYADSTKIPIATVEADVTTLDNVRLWDPSNQISRQTFQRKQDISAYYTFPSVQMDRYTIRGTLRPAIVGARQVDATDLPAKGWVNEHLQYTHGTGVVIAQANEGTVNGNPVFTVGDVPPKSVSGYPKVRQPSVYFGVTDPGYVIANTRQSELDYQRVTGRDVASHYSGSGGVKLGSFFTRAAFAARFGDLNLLLSNLVTPKSKLIFDRDVRTMAEKVAPFLSFDSDPHAALIDGKVDWLLNAYTTTANFPYSQNASTAQVPPGSGLPSSYNYARNSVMVVVNAYSGKMTFYAMGDDPILRAYEMAFPGMFKQEATMPAAIRAHLQYGTDLFAAQAAIYGRYHITSPSQFYTAGDAWAVSPTTGVGKPDQALVENYVLNQQGQVVSGFYQPMSPVSQTMALPGEVTQSFTITDAYVPAGGGSASAQVLRAFLVGDSNPSDFGQLHAYETPPGASKVAPVGADSEIQQTATISSEISLLNKEGSQVLLGNVLPVPVNQSMVYVRPLYVESRTEPQPQLKFVIAVLGQDVKMRRTLAATLDALLGTTFKSTGGLLTTTPNAVAGVGTPSAGPGSHTNRQFEQAVQQARTDLAHAEIDYKQAQTDLRSGNLGGYQDEVAAAQTLTAKAQQLLATVGDSSGESGGTGGGTGASGTGSPAGAGAGTGTGAGGGTGGGTGTGAGGGTGTGAGGDTTSGTSANASTASSSSGTSGAPTYGRSDRTSESSTRAGTTTTSTSPNEM